MKKINVILMMALLISTLSFGADMSTTNTTDKVQLGTISAKAEMYTAKGVDAKVSGLSSNTTANIYQAVTNLDTIATITNTIVVSPTVPIYKLTVTNLTSALAFDISGLNLVNQSATWETWVTIATTNISFSYPSTNSVYYVTTPTLTTTVANQTLYATWRAFITGTTTNIFCNQYLSK